MLQQLPGAVRSVIALLGFNGHPPLGVNATDWERAIRSLITTKFQWAPTLGGECYTRPLTERIITPFNRFNGHPPLGVNATHKGHSAVHRRH